ncbi:hypothetical protein [Pumilibacter intestinalis]|uniref:hypothetical protein n=1 Tax=Pumilibacter intestinalis TaxID=2941511 RepID=UPI002040B9A0|nr:hypothetical protein [Pumilibacter intestinalis]MCI8488024.1 hypothetical protein [Clostridia bacterium]
MKCPKCGHDMGKSAKCLRCGYTVKAVIPVEPDKIEHEQSAEERREIDPKNVRMSRSGGGIFEDIFGGSIFGNLGNIFGGLFGGFGLFDDEPDGYEYDPKYYDDFGNEIYIPDEFERESVEIADVEILEEQPHRSEDKAEEYGTNKSRKHKHKPHKDRS